MNKTIPIIMAIASVGLGLTFAFVSDPTESSAFVYVPSDISKANPNVRAGQGSASMDTLDPTDVKDKITNTVIGKVLTVEDPINWINVNGRTSGAVAVTIKVIENIKGKADERLTFYLHGRYFGDEFYLAPYEAQFEIGEKTLVHLYRAAEFEFQEGKALYVVIGENGKYKIGEDNKAYNKNHKQGKDLDSAKNESK